MDVAEWLDGLGLGQYAAAFRDNAVEAAVLPSLTAEDLKEIGVVAVGHRRRLLDAIAALRPGAEVQAPPAREAAAGERRQVTVLFADLAGYTALSSAIDAEDVHALLEAFFRRVDGIVVGHGGHVDKHIGDCVMAVFGAPIAHGNDAARAAAAALAIRDAMPELAREVGRPIGVHIGLAGGQVVASGTGSDAHRAYTVTGDTVNLASRLTDAAATGEILIAEAVRGELAERIEAAAVGDLVVKGLADPVRVWRLDGLRATAAARPFAGRRGELQQLTAVLADARDSGHGRAVLLRGEAGIGKTRLVEEVRRLALDAGFASHAAQVLDFGTATGRDAIRALVRDLIGLDAGSDAAAATAAAGRAIEAGPIAPDDEVYLNDLLDLPQPRRLRGIYAAMDNTHRNQGKRRVVARLVEAASRQRPLLLVVEDIHWAEPLALAHLARIAALTADGPTVLLMTSRIDGDPLDQAWRADAAGAALTTIDLGPLRVDEARAVAVAVLTANADLVERCIERAAGNPLFLDQLLRHTAEIRSDASVPGSVKSLVQARLDRLEPLDKAALQAASVLGQRFEGAALGHLLGQADYAPDRLVARQLLRPEGGGSFLFAHALVRDAVYDSLLKARRRELHRTAAGWWATRDAVLHAEHLDRAEAPEAAAAYLEAARAQAAEYRYESARRLVARGMVVAREPADRFALACVEGEILHDLGAMAEAQRAYEAALEQAVDDGDRCQAWLGLAACKRVTDDLAGAAADLARAETAATRLGDVVALARAHFLAGNLCFPRGDIDGCLAHHGRSLELARQAGSAAHEAAALGGLGDAAYMRCRMRTAHQHFSECVAIARRHGLGRVEVANLSMIPHCLGYLHRFDEALAVGREARDLAERVGDKRAMIVALNAIANAAVSRGLAPSARLEIAESIQLARDIGARRFEAHGMKDQASVLIAEGRPEEARALLEQALELARASGLGFVGPWLLAMLAALVDDEARRGELRAEARALLAAGSPGHNYFWFYRIEIESALDRNDLEATDAAATAFAALSAAEPLPWSDFWIRLARAFTGHAHAPRAEDAEAELRALQAEAERCGMRGPAMRLRAAFGGAWAGSGAQDRRASGSNG